MGLSDCTRCTLRYRSFALIAALVTVLWAAVALDVCAAPPKVPGGTASAKTKQAASGPQAAKKLLQQAEQLQAKGKYVDAELVLQDAMKAAPDLVDVYAARAKCYDALSYYSRALENWQKAVKMAPKNEEFQRGLARTASKANDLELAKDAWSKILIRNPQDLEACNVLSNLYLNNNDFDDAATWNATALESQPDDPQANYVKACLLIHDRSYGEAEKILNNLLGRLPENHPLMDKCVAKLDDISSSKRKQYLFLAAVIGLPAGIAIIAIVCYRLMQKSAEPDEPVLELEAATEDTVCRFLLQYCHYKFDLPRGFCWSMSIDKRRLVLQMSQLIAETSGVAQIRIDRGSLDNWLKARGTAPFLYEAELDDENFKKAFAPLIKELADIRIDVGVPIVLDNELLAFVLVGGSRNTRKDKIRQRFNEYAETVQDVSEKAGAALQRILQRNSRVIDSKTGMWNREYYEESFNNILRGCKMAQVSMGVFMMRMDQLPGKLETCGEDEADELLYNVGQLVIKGISGEMNVTLCHLDNGTFVLIAPERTEKEAEQLAKELKNCFERTDVLGEGVRTTGSVAYCVAIEDGDDPLMLRSMLIRTFREINYKGGNDVQRVVKISDEPVEEEEPKPQEELIIRRTRRPGETGEQSASYQPFGKARITSNADLGDVPDNSTARLRTSENGKVVTLGAVAAIDAVKPKPKASLDAQGHLKVVGNISRPKKDEEKVALAKDKPSQDSAVSAEKAPAAEPPVKLSKPHPAESAEPAKSAESAKPEPAKSSEPQGIDYSLNLQYDDDGVELETQCCSQEVFEELVGFELEQASESGENCALVYLHIDNLEDIRSTGRSNYMKLRRELSSLMRAFLREDIDIPGIIDEDDFAVFMTGSAKTAASSLADRLNLTSPNLDAGGYFMAPAVGVVLVQSGTGITASELLARGKALAHGKGIHYEE